MTTQWLTILAPLLASAACSSQECMASARPRSAAVFVVTAQDAVTQQPLTMGVSVVADDGSRVSCDDMLPFTPDGGATSCSAKGWDVDFYGQSVSTGSVAHTITVSSQGYRTANVQVTADFNCGDGSYPPKSVVASLQPL